MHLTPEMTYRETIAGPWRPTTGSPLGERLCWAVPAATITGPRIRLSLGVPMVTATPVNPATPAQPGG